MNTHIDDTTQYGTIGSQWEDARSLPTVHPESHTFLNLLGPLTGGQRVLDLACGTGYYTRRIAALGAADVLGTDISATMIAAAQVFEESTPSGARYACTDARDHPQVGEFDVVTAAYLLNYANDLAEMTAMARGARRNLRAGGTFLGVTQNPSFSFEGPVPDPYGFRFRLLERTAFGRFIEVTAALDPPVTFTTCLATPASYSAALQAAGFTAPEWISMTVPPRAVKAYGAPFWSGFESNPPIVVLRAQATSDSTQ